MKNIRKENQLTAITVANKTTMPIVCVGNVKIGTLVGDEKFNVRVKDILYVPGLNVVFNKKDCEIYNKEGTLIAVADLSNNVYKLNFVRELQNAILAANAVTVETWHHRFGHINYNDLKLMRKCSVNGLDCKDAVNSSEVCVVCCEGKQTKQPFKDKGNRATSRLGIVHADLSGPVEVISPGSIFCY